MVIGAGVTLKELRRGPEKGTPWDPDPPQDVSSEVKVETEVHDLENDVDDRQDPLGTLLKFYVVLK